MAMLTVQGECALSMPQMSAYPTTAAAGTFALPSRELA